MLVASHRAYQLYAHITWHTWRRVGCLDEAAVQDVATAMKNAEAPTHIRVLERAVLADHVHVLVSFRPDTALSDFVRLVKSGAAYRANARIPGAVRWARGFYAASVHKRDLARIVVYIRGQHRRHPDRIPQRTRNPTDPGRQPGDHQPADSFGFTNPLG
jgi:putative transposase